MESKYDEAMKEYREAVAGIDASEAAALRMVVDVALLGDKTAIDGIKAKFPDCG